MYPNLASLLTPGAGNHFIEIEGGRWEVWEGKMDEHTEKKETK